MPIDQAKINRNMHVWWQTMEATHALILAGLRQKIGPGEDLQAAYRQWYRHQRDLASERLERDAAQRLQQNAESIP